MKKLNINSKNIYQFQSHRNELLLEFDYNYPRQDIVYASDIVGIDKSLDGKIVEVLHIDHCDSKLLIIDIFVKQIVLESPKIDKIIFYSSPTYVTFKGKGYIRKYVTDKNKDTIIICSFNCDRPKSMQDVKSAELDKASHPYLYAIYI